MNRYDCSFRRTFINRIRWYLMCIRSFSISSLVKVPHLQKSAWPLLAVPFLLDPTWDHCRFGMSACHILMLVFRSENDGKVMIKLSKLGGTLFLDFKHSTSKTKEVLIHAKIGWQMPTDEALQCIPRQISMPLSRTTMRIECEFSPGAWGSSPEPDNWNNEGWKQQA